MFNPPFAYVVPRSVPELLALLDEHEADAKVLTGGQSLVPLLKLRLVRPAIIADANRLPGLDRVTDDGTHLSVGALVRHRQLRTDPLIGRYFPWLPDMVPLIGDPQVRTLGTLAGTLVEADPAGDWSAAMLALGAEICAVSSAGRRVIPIADWFIYSYTPALKDNEFVEAVRLRKPVGRSGGCYVKVEKRAGDFAVAGCAVSVEADPSDGSVVARVGLTGLAQAPLECLRAARALSGLGPDGVTAGALAAAKEAVQAAIDPIGDARGSAVYKREIANVVLERAAATAFQVLAGGEAGTTRRGAS
jgi:aerobic carbon-monoxide dehydrogenase medium subunit